MQLFCVAFGFLLNFTMFTAAYGRARFRRAICPPATYLGPAPDDHLRDAGVSRTPGWARCSDRQVRADPSAAVRLVQISNL